MIDANGFQRFTPLGELHPTQRERLLRKTRLERLDARQILAVPGPERERLFLLSGTLDLYDAARQPLQRLQAHTCGAAQALQLQCPQARQLQAVSAVELLICDAGLLDALLSWTPSDSLLVVESPGSLSDGDWMSRMLGNPLFLRVPALRLQALFIRGQRTEVSAGEAVIHQGAPGDGFYVLTAGRAVVQQRGASGPVWLKELDAGAMFGEEALIGEEPRNATVRMLTDGQVLKLTKRDFHELLQDSVERRIDWQAASEAVAERRARWLDVRPPSACTHGSPAGAVNIPLSQLRQRLAELDRDGEWIVCCDSGRHSAIGAFLLVQHGYDALVLRGGLRSR